MTIPPTQQPQAKPQTQPYSQATAPPPPSLPPSQQPQTQAYGKSAAAPPPPPPPPPPAMSTMSSGSTPAPPAPPPPDMSGGSFTESTGDAGRDALLSSIRGAGIGSLKKTDKSQLEKPSVVLQEARGEPMQTNDTSSVGGNAAGAPPATLADALSVALNKRKGKVAHSDDEDDDEW